MEGYAVNEMQIRIINEDFVYTGRPVEHKASCVIGQSKAQVQRRNWGEEEKEEQSGDRCC